MDVAQFNRSTYVEMKLGGESKLRVVVAFACWFVLPLAPTSAR